jgi:hypothetical protein
MKMNATITNLHQNTIDILRERAEEIDSNIMNSVADDDHESADSWRPTLASIVRVLEDPQAATLRAEKLAACELNWVLDRDEYVTASGSPTTKSCRVTADLCRAGFHDKFYPDAFYSHKPRTMLVDGVRYCV